MCDTLTFLELTTYSESNPQGYDDKPSFQSDIWPLFVNTANKIQHVYLFINSNWSDHKRLKAQGVSAGSCVDLGSMGLLTKKDIKELEHLSFFGGHLNVLYLIEQRDRLIQDLLKLFKKSGVTLRCASQGLSLHVNEQNELRGFLAQAVSSHIFASFGHDGDPLFLFGKLPVLQGILEYRNSE
jgi:hypothetical protein